MMNENTLQQENKERSLSLFISYAHEDDILRQQLERHLSVLRRQGLIADWHDRLILAGGEWAHDIGQHLETSSIILLLISSDFLASDYCYENEMQHAFERHRRGDARVIPIILRECDWQHSPLKALQGLPPDGKPITQWQDQDKVFHLIIQSLRRIIEQQESSTLLHSSWKDVTEGMSKIVSDLLPRKFEIVQITPSSSKIQRITSRKGRTLSRRFIVVGLATSLATGVALTLAVNGLLFALTGESCKYDD